MAALPKKKLSKARTQNRRSNFVASLPALLKCSNCAELIPPHKVCPFCGYLGRKAILKIKTS